MVLDLSSGEHHLKLNRILYVRSLGIWWANDRRGERVVVSSFNYEDRRWHGVCASRLYVPFFLVVGEEPASLSIRASSPHLCSVGCGTG